VRAPKSRKRAAKPVATIRHVEAYVQIRNRIMEGELLPDDPLSEYQLAQQLKLSRTPVREALKRLEHEGLVRFIFNRGAFVAGLDVHDIVEIYQVREQLEGFAAHVAATVMPVEDANTLDDELGRAQRLAAEGKVRETFESGIHLHKQIIRVTNNHRLANILATLDNQVRRIRGLTPHVHGRIEHTLCEHREIVECIKRRDSQGAQEAMTRHLRAAAESAIRMMSMLRSRHDSPAELGLQERRSTSGPRRKSMSR
jgi:GntR family transcriptional regulator, rspAB operon transcriptional repressor